MSYNKLIIKIITIEKNSIFDKTKLNKVVKELIALNSNLMIFGLANSGKSTLVKTVCNKDNRFETLDEEEITDDEDTILLNQDTKKWAVGHQYPTSDETVSDTYLEDFFMEHIGLNPEKWAIIRIKSK